MSDCVMQIIQGLAPWHSQVYEWYGNDSSHLGLYLSLYYSTYIYHSPAVIILQHFYHSTTEVKPEKARLLKTRQSPTERVAKPS